MFLEFKRSIFQFFANFWVTKLKPFFWESEAKRSKLFKLKFDDRNLLKKCFWSYLELENECSERLKRAFSAFCKFLSDEVETVFWKREAKRSRLFKWKFGHKNFLRKWFWRNLELKNECSELLKRAFLSFWQFFEWQSWNRFLGKWGKVSGNYLNQNLV